jgi:putative transposase
LSKKRHTPQEIGAKLRQAREMAQAGKLQSEIARVLGISVMTYHRWRKAGQWLPAVPAHDAVPGRAMKNAETEGRLKLSDLELENLRLRRLVSDLLIEKMKLEEQLEAPVRPRRVG